MRANHFEYFSNKWDVAIRDFELAITRSLGAFANEKSKEKLQTFEILSSAPGEFSFKFALHFFTVRLEAKEKDFTPFVECRRKRDLSDPANPGEVTYTGEVDELHGLRSVRSVAVDSRIPVLLALTGLDKVEFEL